MNFSKRFQTIHIETCMAATRNPSRRTWEGPFSGRVPCEVCENALATTGHHLIISRGKMMGYPQWLKLEIAAEEMNLALVCWDCHHGSIEGLRDMLIEEVAYRIYGEENVKQWVQWVESQVRTKIPLPGRMCRWCRLSGNGSCPYDACTDGRMYFERLSYAEMEARR